MTRTLLASVHVRHLYAFCGHSPYMTTFRESSIALDRVTALEKKETFDYICSTSTDRSVGLHLISLSITTIEAVEKVKHPLTNKLHRFTSHISPACDQYVQYLLTGVNLSILNRHRQGFTNLDVSTCHITLSNFPN
jgi:hypothetical protein